MTLKDRLEVVMTQAKTTRNSAGMHADGTEAVADVTCRKCGKSGSFVIPAAQWDLNDCPHGKASPDACDMCSEEIAKGMAAEEDEE